MTTYAQVRDGIPGDCSYDYTHPIFVIYSKASASIAANTTVLLHFDGDWIDQTGKTWTPSRVTIDGATVKFGSGSGKFQLPSNAGDVPYYYLSTPTNADFAYGTGDYTIDFWFNPYSYTSSNPSQIIRREDPAPGTELSVYINKSVDPKTLIVVQHGSAYTFTFPAGEPAIGAWCHITVVRSSGNLTVYFNGTATAEGSVSAGDNIAQHAVQISDNGYQIAMQAYLDEYRESSVARWVAPFAPPTTAYPPP